MLTEQEKIRLLERVDAEARRIDPRVKQVIVSLAGEHEVVMVASTDGTLSADVRPLVRFNVSVNKDPPAAADDLITNISWKMIRH